MYETHCEINNIKMNYSWIRFSFTVFFLLVIVLCFHSKNETPLFQLDRRFKDPSAKSYIQLFCYEKKMNLLDITTLLNYSEKECITSDRSSLLKALWILLNRHTPN